MNSESKTRAIVAIFLWLTLLFLLTGCTALRRPEELAWQGMRVADTLATLAIVGDPCYEEGHPLTRAMIGPNPTREDVLIWGAGGAIVHATVSEALLQKGWKKTYNLWQAITIIDTGAALHKGWSVGVRIGGDNKRRIENGCR